MQFGFVPICGTTNAIFILRQLQQKHLVKKKNLYFAFVDLGKAFDGVPRDAVRWALRKLSIEGWLVKIVLSMRLSLVIFWSRWDYIRVQCQTFYLS